MDTLYRFCVLDHVRHSKAFTELLYGGVRVLMMIFSKAEIENRLNNGTNNRNLPKKYPIYVQLKLISSSVISAECFIPLSFYTLSFWIVAFKYEYVTQCNFGYCRSKYSCIRLELTTLLYYFIEQFLEPLPQDSAV